MRDCGTLWIMLEDALVENKVFRTNFIHLVYASLVCAVHAGIMHLAFPTYDWSQLTVSRFPGL